MVNRMAKMDLKLAYNKIDNLCCLNHNIHQKEFFEAYAETQDEDFCKDAYEMVDALETIKEIVDLQEDFGGSLVMILNLMKNSHRLLLPKLRHNTQSVITIYTGQMKMWIV